MTSSSSPRLNADQRRALLAEDETFFGKPFDVTGNPRAIQAHTRRLAMILRDETLPDRAQRAAAYAAALLDTLIDHNVKGLRDRNEIACGMGCAHCCTTAVSATIPEALYLAATLRGDIRRAARIRETAHHIAGLPARTTTRTDCPVLEANACAGYVARPTACRGLLSTSLATCMEIFHRQGAVPMTYAAATSTIRTVVVIMMKAALATAGLGAAHVSLGAALAVALSTPDAEARWLAGEPLFDGLPADKAEQNLHLGNLVTTLRDAVLPTL